MNKAGVIAVVQFWLLMLIIALFVFCCIKWPTIILPTFFLSVSLTIYDLAKEDNEKK